MKQEHAVGGDVIANLKSFFVRVIVVSILLSMYLSHADANSLTNPKF